MDRPINILVTCTSRKTLVPPARLRMRSVQKKTIAERAKEWIDRLTVNSTPQTLAAELYCGEYWSIARSLPAVAREAGIAARIWICSAGYGLLSPQSKVCSYSATFSPGEPDSATRGFDSESRRVAAQQWWSALAKWSGPKHTELRSITAIADTYPTVPLLVVASPDYLHAIEQDLVGAVRSLATSSLLLIASAGIKTFGKLTDHLLPCDARLQSCLGGTRASLNIRIAKRLLQNMGRGPIILEQQKSQLRRLLDKQPAIKHYGRRAMTDEQIRDFIRLESKKNRGASRSLLLRKLRDGGRACEQSRFADLYGDTVGR